MTMNRENLETALLNAHDRRDVFELVRLYSIAADRAEQRDDIDAACFFLTHAFVFALEAGAPEADRLNQRLADRGRAERLPF